MKTKLLIVTDYFYPHWTGYAKWMYYLVCALKGKLDVTVLTVQHKSDLKREDNIFTARIIREPHFFTISRSRYSVKIIVHFLRMVSHYDVVIINSPCINILPLSLITKLFRKKLLILHQGDLVLPKGIVNRIIEKVFDVSSLLSFAISDKVSTYTKDYAKHSRVMKRFLQKFTPLLLPIYIQYNKSTNHNSQLTTLHRLKREEKVLFGFAGRFVEEKGFDILFEAIPKVLDNLPQAHFVFAGEINMPYERFFQKTQNIFTDVKSHVTLLGLLDSEQMANFYKLIDFIVVPSRSDCFNLVQAEAMLCGTPSIVADIPGARYLVKETGFGMLFEKENPYDLAEKIVFAVKNKKNIMKHFKKLLNILNKEKNAQAVRRFIES